jgi:hypothetical protein
VRHELPQLLNPDTGHPALFGAAAPDARPEPQPPAADLWGGGSEAPDPTQARRDRFQAPRARVVSADAVVLTGPRTDEMPGEDLIGSPESVALPQTWRPRGGLLWRQLDRFRERVDADAWSFLTDPAVVTTVTVSVGYVILNVRTLYLFTSVLLTTPLWRQLDPLAVLEVWEANGKGGPAGTAEDREEEELRPILG